MIWKSSLALGALAALLLPASVPAQLLDGADWFEREIAEGVTWRYYHFDNLFNSKQSISYIEADLDDPNIEVEFPYLASSRNRTSVFTPAQFPNAVAAVNGTYFDTSAGGGGATTYLRIDNVEITAQSGSSWNNNSAITKTAAGAVSVIGRPGGGWASNTTRTDIMANGPRTQNNGTIPDFTSSGAHCSARHPRTAVGMTADNRIILVTVDGRTTMAAGVSCDELAQIMEALGCTNSINMDGGGSTTMWVKSEISAGFSGVVNYPSDNGLYDHAGERSCSNAIALVAPPLASQAALDGRLLSVTYTPTMVEGTTQNVSLVYENIGTQSWSVTSTTLEVSRPNTRTSALEHASWVNSQIPAVMSPAVVAPGQQATFSFTLEAPMVAIPTQYDETFALYDVTEGRFGPADNEALFSVYVEEPIGSSVVVESRRPNGDLSPEYTEPAGALSNTTSKSTATDPPLVGTGSRYTSTVGRKGRFTPEIGSDGFYDVYVTVGGNPNTNNNALTNYVIQCDEPSQRTGSVRLLWSDTTVGHAWKLLQSDVKMKAGTTGYIEFTNVDGDSASERFVMDAVRFELKSTSVEDWRLAN